MPVKRDKDIIRRKMTKINIPERIPATKTGWDEYFSTISLQMCPSNEAFRERLALELLEWAKTDDALILEEFFDIKGIDDSDVARWLKTCEPLLKAYNTAKRMISYRREKGALKNELNPGTVHIVMPHYSKIWKDTEQWRSDMKKEQEQQGKIKIEFETYQDSPLVPDKKKE